MQLQKSHERQTTEVSITIVICLKIFWIENLEIMATVTSTPQKTQGRARGLLLVWRRELEQKLQINHYLLGCSREEP